MFLVLFRFATTNAEHPARPHSGLISDQSLLLNLIIVSAESAGIAIRIERSVLAALPALSKDFFISSSSSARSAGTCSSLKIVTSSVVVS